MDVFKGMLRHRKGDPPAHRVPEEMGAGNAEVGQHRDDIRRIGFRLIGLRFIWLVARTMPAGIDQDQPIIRLQTVDITEFVPGLEAVAEPVLQYEGRAMTLNLV